MCKRGRGSSGCPPFIGPTRPVEMARAGETFYECCVGILGEIDLRAEITRVAGWKAARPISASSGRGADRIGGHPPAIGMRAMEGVREASVPKWKSFSSHGNGPIAQPVELGQMSPHAT
ncbi:hypothetical protein ELH67_36740 (plasmid) [Rhizobium ruizarguesonis]|nr:hypothetical protein ELH67_36740 [Rhizobium ruizarguesonis]TBA30135.1 hypothetical protein ELH60_36175 [Rhizobium ruizarguesonis]TBC63811.1 hypothetical protein ELH36_14105 [Rhizobium ruizarguesonis]